MRINFRIIWLALPLVFGACSDSSDADTPGNNNFILTVTENNGLSTTKTLKYYVPAN